jgi:hypothetical protein
MKKLIVLVLCALVTTGIVSANAAQELRHNNCAHRVIGDINGDGETNIYDFSLLHMAWQTSKGEPGFDERADMNCDGFVGDVDFEILKLGYWQPATVRPDLPEDFVR